MLDIVKDTRLPTKTFSNEQGEVAYLVKDGVSCEWHIIPEMNPFVLGTDLIYYMGHRSPPYYIAGTIENGQAFSVVDELSGVEQTVSYDQSGVAKGQPSVTTETDDTHVYDVEFGYNALGEREIVTLVTPNGVTKWKYDGWQEVCTRSRHLPARSDGVFDQKLRSTYKEYETL